jgi:MOSC domain-containing protein YiiM
MKIVALFVGSPRSCPVADGVLFTGGAKSPVASAVLGMDGFEGDGQADRRHHGGRDRAACLYVSGHYDWWKSAHGFDLGPGAFCENLTVDGAREEDICIGDVFRIGEALAQVTLPRDPCRTLDRLTGIKNLWTLARESGRCGFHMRTLEGGVVRNGDAFQPVSTHPARITVAEVLDLYHGRSRDLNLFRRLEEMPEFGDQGKREIAARLGG